MKRVAVSTAFALVLLATPALAQTPPQEQAQPQPQQQPPQGQWRSASDLATHLTEGGYRVLKLERESDGYEVELADREGNLVKARVHPVTGALLTTHADGRARAAVPHWHPLAQVARQLEDKGFLIRKLEVEKSGYEAELTDRAGARTEVVIDPTTGAIQSSKPD